MKCPNCGMDIVIATHLCPHCGYAHDFDGSIEPRREIPEPWEITQEKSRKRREKRERAASTWARSRAGRGAQEAAYVRDDRVREQDAVKHGSADEDVPERLWTFTRNLVLASLILCAALLFAASAFYLTGAYFELDGRYTSSYAYWMLPELRLLDTILYSHRTHGHHRVRPAPARKALRAGHAGFCRGTLLHRTLCLRRCAHGCF